MSHLLTGMSQPMQTHRLLFAVQIDAETGWKQGIFVRLGIAMSLTRWRYFTWSLILDPGHYLTDIVMRANRKHYSTLHLSGCN